MNQAETIDWDFSDYEASGKKWRELKAKYGREPSTNSKDSEEVEDGKWCEARDQWFTMRAREHVKDADKIKTAIAPVGNWYRLDHCSQEKRCWIDRVILWTVVGGIDTTDHVEGVTGQGESYSDHEVFFVLGQDKSPLGPTWDEVYASAEVSHYLVREITQVGLFGTTDESIEARKKALEARENI